jgi:membrane-bound lytic murein transglycosylase D
LVAGGKGLKTWKNFIGPLGILLALTSCGFSKGGVKSDGGLFNTKSEGGLLNVAGGASRSPSGAYTSESLDGDIMGVRLQNKNFDLPVVYNKEVAQWVDYFTGVGRRHFNVYLERKAKFEPVILPRLREAGLPEDLIYLAMIESGFSTAAHSHAGAVGPWQFIRSTGRLFGLQADWWYDERRDPIKSTEAAIQYLSRLHAEFGDWYLATAAYNSGEGKIRRAISRLGTRDFWEIASNRRALMRETKDYVPKMLAAAIIGKNAEAFGFKTHAPDNSLLEFEEVRIPRAENLRTIAKVANISHDRLAELNPELQRCCTPPQRGSYTIRMPKGEAAALLVAAVDAGEIGRYAGFRRHVVRRGDNLSSIAKRNGVPVEAILSMNEIRSVRSLKLGTELVIPERGGRAAPARVVASSDRGPRRSVASVSSARRAPAGQQAVTHVVRKGDTLYGISRRYAVRVEQIRRWNDIQRSKNLRPGSRIKLYVRNENSDRI